MKLDAMKTEKRRDAPMKRVKAIGIAVLALGMLQSASAYSDVIGHLEFTQPSGTAYANDTINVRVKLTLDGSSDSLAYTPTGSGWNGTDEFWDGINGDDIPNQGYDENYNLVDFASYSSISLFTFRYCTDSFTASCGSAGTSQYDAIGPASESWFDFQGTMGPDASREFNLFQWEPIGGSATPGVYDFYTGGLGFSAVGSDSLGHLISADIYSFDTTNNCMGGNCTFTRTVSPVPLPAAAWLFGSALAGLGFVRKYKRRTLLTA